MIACLIILKDDNIKKCFLSLDQHIKMISEEVCDTEDW